MRRLPPLSSVRVFDAAARHENFTRAAAELGMTQAAVSYQIRLLEERLGLSLFTRAKGVVTLTEAGRRIAPLVGSAFETMEDAFAALIADDQGLLSISTAQTFATTWLAPRLGSFQVLHPNLAVRLTTDNALVDFTSGEDHVAIRMGRGAWSGLKCHLLFRLHVAPICSAEFAAEHRIERPEQLLDLPAIGAGDRLWRGWFGDMGVEPPPEAPSGGLVLDNQVMEARAALAGAGVAMMMPTFWRPELASGRLVQPFPHLHFPGTSYWLVYPEPRRNQPKIAAFRDWLLGEVRGMAASEPPEIFSQPA